MPSFVCDECQSTLKKAKLDSHASSCGSQSFSCIDCGVSFRVPQYRSHTQCITEAEKYEKKAPVPKRSPGQGIADVQPKKMKDQAVDLQPKKIVDRAVDLADKSGSSIYQICKSLSKDQKKQLLKSIVVNASGKGAVTLTLIK